MNTRKLICVELSPYTAVRPRVADLPLWIVKELEIVSSGQPESHLIQALHVKQTTQYSHIQRL